MSTWSLQRLDRTGPSIHLLMSRWRSGHWRPLEWARSSASSGRTTGVRGSSTSCGMLSSRSLKYLTFGHIPRLLTEKDVRRRALRHVEDKVVRDFWFSEYERYSPRFRSVVIAPLQNKIGAMLTDPRLRRILTAEKNSFDLREAMDRGKILLINLSKGEVGEGPAALLGSLLVSHLGLTGLSRADETMAARQDFFVYLDEFQIFATLSLANMLSELRKYHVNLTLAHQFLSQLEPEVRDAVIGNVGTLISFRLGANDAAFIAREFSPTFEPDDLIRLPNFQMYLKLLINGQPSRSFSAETTLSDPRTAA